MDNYECQGQLGEIPRGFHGSEMGYLPPGPQLGPLLGLNGFASLGHGSAA
jgi:hypothetical protein